MASKDKPAAWSSAAQTKTRQNLRNEASMRPGVFMEGTWPLPEKFNLAPAEVFTDLESLLDNAPSISCNCCPSSQAGWVTCRTSCKTSADSTGWINWAIVPTSTCFGHHDGRADISWSAPVAASREWDATCNKNSQNGSCMAPTRTSSTIRQGLWIWYMEFPSHISFRRLGLSPHVCPVFVAFAVSMALVFPCVGIFLCLCWQCGNYVCSFFCVFMCYHGVHVPLGVPKFVSFFFLEGALSSLFWRLSGMLCIRGDLRCSCSTQLASLKLFWWHVISSMLAEIWHVEWAN